MAREIESVHTFTHQSHKFGLEHEYLVMRCDDGAVYEFSKAVDTPTYRLVRRFKPDGTLSTSKAILPAAVKETVNELLGESKWHK